MLYAAAARACKAIGYEVIQTYILGTELGTSLKAAGWTFDGQSGRATWHIYRPNRRTDQPMDRKGRWSIALNPPRPQLSVPRMSTDQVMIWDEADGEEPAA